MLRGAPIVAIWQNVGLCLGEPKDDGYIMTLVFMHEPERFAFTRCELRYTLSWRR